MINGAAAGVAQSSFAVMLGTSVGGLWNCSWLRLHKEEKKNQNLIVEHVKTGVFSIKTAKCAMILKPHPCLQRAAHADPAPLLR